MPRLFSNITIQSRHMDDLFTVTLPDRSCLSVNFGGAKIRTEPLVPKNKSYKEKQNKLKYTRGSSH